VWIFKGEVFGKDEQSQTESEAGKKAMA